MTKSIILALLVSMRPNMKSALIAILLCGAAFAHSATLTWSDSVNPAGTSYTVYRADGLCSDAPAFMVISSAISVMNYVDFSVVGGSTYCYEVTASYGGIESSPSDSVTAMILVLFQTMSGATISGATIGGSSFTLHLSTLTNGQLGTLTNVQLGTLVN